MWCISSYATPDEPRWDDSNFNDIMYTAVKKALKNPSDVRARILTEFEHSAGDIFPY